MNTGRSRQALLLLGPVLLLGLGLRLWGIGFGLPLQTHADESLFVRKAAAHASGDLNPHRFVQTPVTSWILAGCWGVRFTVMKLFGLCDSVGAYKDGFLTDPSGFYIWGRVLIGAIFGAASIWGTWFLARAVASRGIALAAALLMAIAFLPVRNSHFITADMGMLFFATLSAGCWLRYFRRRSIRWLILGGVCCGAAAGFKYNGALFGLLLPIGLACCRPKEWLRDLVTGTAVSIGVLLLLHPFLLLDFAAVRADLAEEGGKHFASPLLHHLTYSLAGGVGWPMLAAAILGAVMMTRRLPARIRLLWLPPLLWYLYATTSALGYARYVLPIIPFLCVGAAYAVGALLPRDRRRALLPVLVLLIALPSLVKCIAFNRLLSGDDSRMELARWLSESPEVEDDSNLALDHSQWIRGAWPNWEFGRSDRQLLLLRRIDTARGRSDERCNRLLRIAEGLERRRFNIFFLVEDEQVEQEGPTFLNPKIRLDPTELDRMEIDLLVRSGRALSLRWERLGDFPDSAEPLWQFNAGGLPEGLAPPKGYENAGLPFLWEDIVTRRRIGPNLSVYRWNGR